MMTVPRIFAACLLLPALAFLPAGCSDPPDLTPVEATFAPGTPGAGAKRVSSGLAGTSFGKTIAQAVRTHPDLRRATAQLRIASAEARGTEGAFLPSVSIGAEAQNRTTGTTRSSGVTPYLRVSQLVYDGGAAKSDEVAASARVLERKGDRLQAASGAALSAVEIYATLLERRKRLSLTTRNLSVHDDFLAQITDRVTTGAGVQSDLLTAQSRLADARSRKIEAQAQLDRAAAEFREIFGKVPSTLVAPAAAPALPRDSKDIIAQSPRIRALEARLVAARAQLAAAQAQRMPRVEAGATGQRLNDGRSDVSFDLSVNYRFDSAGKRRAAVETAQARIEDLSIEREALAREITRALDFVRSDQKAGAARVAAAREAARANERNVEAAREEFTIGGRSLLEVLDAQRDFVIAQETLVAAEKEHLLTGYAALALTGDILDVFGVSVLDADPTP